MTSIALEQVACRAGARSLWHPATIALGPGVTVINGPSGSGKSTLLEVLAALRRPDQGTVRWRGKRLAGTTLDEFRACRGYCPAERWDARTMTVRTTLRWTAVLWGVERPEAAAVREEMRWGLRECAAERVALLSQGYQRRVLLASSLVMSPEVWLVDRPYEGLDLEGRVTMQTVLAAVLTGEPGVPRLAVLADATAEDLPAALQTAPMGGGGLTLGRLSVSGADP